MILSWCFDVLTKILISHLLTCHRLPITPYQPPTPSHRQIPSNTSSTRGKRNMEVRNGWQVYLPDTFRLLTFSFFHLHRTGGMLQNAPRTQPTPLPTNRSPRIHQRRGVDEIWRLFVEEKWVGKVRAEVKNYCLLFFAFWHLTSAWWLLRLCKQQHATINHSKCKTTTIKTTNTQQSTLGWCFTLPEVSEEGKLLLVSYFLFNQLSQHHCSSNTCSRVRGAGMWVI
jgi:hypothetical protein